MSSLVLKIQIGFSSFLGSWGIEPKSLQYMSQTWSSSRNSCSLCAVPWSSGNQRWSTNPVGPFLWWCKCRVESCLWCCRRRETSEHLRLGRRGGRHTRNCRWFHAPWRLHSTLSGRTDKTGFGINLNSLEHYKNQTLNEEKWWIITVNSDLLTPLLHIYVRSPCWSAVCTSSLLRPPAALQTSESTVRVHTHTWSHFDPPCCTSPFLLRSRNTVLFCSWTIPCVWLTVHVAMRIRHSLGRPVLTHILRWHWESDSVALTLHQD